MEFRLNELQETIRASAREYAHTYLRPRIDEIEHAEKFPQDLIDVMADMGFIGLSYPEAYGGLDAGYLCEAIAIEEISKVSPSAGKLLTVCLLPLDAIHLFGTEMQKMKYLPDGISGKDIGSLAFTEPGTGSDPKQLTTTAKRVGDKYIINGTKRFISNAAHEGHIVVVARDEKTAFRQVFHAAHLHAPEDVHERPRDVMEESVNFFVGAKFHRRFLAGAFPRKLFTARKSWR